MVVKPFQMSGRGQKALLEGREDCKSLPESWEGLGGPEEVGRPPGGLGGFKSPFRRDGRAWEGRESMGTIRMAGKGQETLQKRAGGVGRPYQMDGRMGGPPIGTRGPSIGPEGVAMPSCRAGRSREELPENWEGLGRSGEVGRPARMVGRGREAHLESQEGSIGKEEYGRPSWRAGKGREALTEGQEG